IPREVFRSGGSGPAIRQGMQALQKRRHVLLQTPASRLDEIARQLERSRDGSGSVRRAHGGNASARNAPRHETSDAQWNGQASGGEGGGGSRGWSAAGGSAARRSASRSSGDLSRVAMLASVPR